MTKMISVEMVEKMPSPRVIKTHLPLYLLHPNLLDTSKVRTNLALNKLKQKQS